MKLKPLRFALHFVLLLVLPTGCATDRAPSGGPANTLPLQVTGVTPAPGSTGIQPSSIRFTFSSYISTAALRKSLSISPRMRGYEIRGGGYEAEIRFHEPLEPDRTYTITLNRSLSGHRGNQLGNSFIYAFSTGAVIDSGRIGGKVFTRRNQPAENVTVFAYRQAGTLPSPPLSPGSQPDYIMQTGTDGTFEFHHIQEGTYRLQVFVDSNRDRMFNHEKEMYAAGRNMLVETGASGLVYRLTSPRPSPQQTAMQPAPAESTGSVTGSVQGATGTIVVEACHTETRQCHTIAIHADTPSPKQFTMDELPPGHYIFSAYLPGKSNSDQVPPWNGGSVIPFAPADRFVISTEPQRVRKGWTTGNVRLAFPEQL